MDSVLLRRDDDAPIHVPAPRIDGMWSVRAVAREWPDGPDREVWSTGDGSAVIEGGEVLLLCDRLRGGWSSTEVTVHLTDPSGARTVLDPIRVRLR